MLFRRPSSVIEIKEKENRRNLSTIRSSRAENRERSLSSKRTGKDNGAAYVRTRSKHFSQYGKLEVQEFKLTINYSTGWCRSDKFIFL